jgi:hypothetical protein
MSCSGRRKDKSQRVDQTLPGAGLEANEPPKNDANALKTANALRACRLSVTRQNGALRNRLIRALAASPPDVGLSPQWSDGSISSTRTPSFRPSWHRLPSREQSGFGDGRRTVVIDLSRSAR